MPHDQPSQGEPVFVQDPIKIEHHRRQLIGRAIGSMMRFLSRRVSPHTYLHFGSQ